MRQQRKLSRKSGFTLIEIMIVILILVLLLSIAIPNFLRARDSSREKSCVSNMRRILDAKEMYAADNKLPPGTPVDWNNLVSDYLRSEPVCPAGGVYNPLTVGETVDCSFEGHDLAF